MLKTIKTFIGKTKLQKLGFLTIAIIAFVGISVAFPEISFADINESITKTNSTGAPETNDLKKTISEFSSTIVSLFTPMLAILIKVSSALMTDEYIMGTNGTATPMAQLLYEVWDISRSFVNYIILFTFLFAAMMNIFPKIGEQYDVIKNYLPKLVLVAILVNLTWFGVRVLLDASNVATHIVYSLPQTVFQTNEAWDKSLKNAKCTVKSDGKDVKTEGMCDPVYFLVNSTGNFLNKKTTENDSNNSNGELSDENVSPSLLGTTELGKEQEANKKENTYGGFSERLNEADAENQKNTKEAVIADLNNQKEKINKNTDYTDETRTSLTKNIDKQIAEITKLKTEKIINYGAITIFWDDFKYENFNEGTIAPLFAYSIMQVQNLPKISTQNTTIAKLLDAETIDSGWVALMTNAVVALLVMVILLILFVMMTIVLIFRIIIIWINIMISPFWVFSFVGVGGPFDIFKHLESSGKGYVGTDTFLGSVFAPATMAIPMVIGFILIQAGTTMGAFGTFSNGITMVGPLVNSVSDIHQVFYYMLCIAVLWMGSKSVIQTAGGDTFFGKWAGGISSMVDGLIDTIPKAISVIPMIPVGTGKNGEVKFNDIKSYTDGPGKLSNYFDEIHRDTVEDLSGEKPITSYLQKDVFNKNKNSYNYVTDALNNKKIEIKKILKEEGGKNGNLKTKPNDIIDLITNKIAFGNGIGKTLKDLDEKAQKAIILNLYDKGNIFEDEIDAVFTETFKNGFPNETTIPDKKDENKKPDKEPDKESADANNTTTTAP